MKAPQCLRIVKRTEVRAPADLFVRRFNRAPIHTQVKLAEVEASRSPIFGKNLLSFAFCDRTGKGETQGRRQNEFSFIAVPGPSSAREFRE